MKKLQMLLTATVLCFSMFALGQSAQDTQQNPPNTQTDHHGWQGRGRGMGMSPEAQLDHMSQMLNLTDDQKAKIKPILEDSSKQMQQLRQDTSLSQEDRRTKMQQIHESTMSQVRPILNADQQKKLDEMKDRRGERGHGPDHDQSSKPQ